MSWSCVRFLPTHIPLQPFRSWQTEGELGSLVLESHNSQQYVKWFWPPGSGKEAVKLFHRHYRQIVTLLRKAHRVLCFWWDKWCLVLTDKDQWECRGVVQNIVKRGWFTPLELSHILYSTHWSDAPKSCWWRCLEISLLLRQPTVWRLCWGCFFYMQVLFSWELDLGCLVFYCFAVILLASIECMQL